jgi:hypothetical protein
MEAARTRVAQLASEAAAAALPPSQSSEITPPDGMQTQPSGPAVESAGGDDSGVTHTTFAEEHVPTATAGERDQESASEAESHEKLEICDHPVSMGVPTSLRTARLGVHEPHSPATATHNKHESNSVRAGPDNTDAIPCDTIPTPVGRAASLNRSPDAPDDDDDDDEESPAAPAAPKSGAKGDKPSLKRMAGDAHSDTVADTTNPEVQERPVPKAARKSFPTTGQRSAFADHATRPSQTTAVVESTSLSPAAARPSAWEPSRASQSHRLPVRRALDLNCSADGARNGADGAHGGHTHAEVMAAAIAQQRACSAAVQRIIQREREEERLEREARLHPPPLPPTPPPPPEELGALDPGQLAFLIPLLSRAHLALAAGQAVLAQLARTNPGLHAIAMHSRQALRESLAGTQAALSASLSGPLQQAMHAHPFPAPLPGLPQQAMHAHPFPAPLPGLPQQAMHAHAFPALLPGPPQQAMHAHAFQPLEAAPYPDQAHAHPHHQHQPPPRPHAHAQTPCSCPVHGPPAARHAHDEEDDGVGEPTGSRPPNHVLPPVRPAPVASSSQPGQPHGQADDDAGSHVSLSVPHARDGQSSPDRSPSSRHGKRN